MTTELKVSPAYEVREKLLQLDAQLNQAMPNMANLLRDIHKQLGADPELVTMLSEEECNILVRGLKKQTGIEIATTAIKKQSKSAKSIGLMDL